MEFKELFKLYSSNYLDEYSLILEYLQQGILIKDVKQLNFIQNKINSKSNISYQLFSLGYFTKEKIDFFYDDEIQLSLFKAHEEDPFTDYLHQDTKYYPAIFKYEGVISGLDFSKLNQSYYIFIKLIKKGNERKKILSVLHNGFQLSLETLSQLLYDKIHQISFKSQNSIDHSFQENYNNALNYFIKTNNKFCVDNLSQFHNTKNLDFFYVVVAYLTLSYEINEEHHNPENSENLRKIKNNVSQISPVLKNIISLQNDQSLNVLKQF